MKRWIAMGLCILLVFAMASCGSQEDVQGEIEPNTEVVESQIPEDVTGELSDQPESEAVEAETEEVESEATTEKPLSLGRMNGGVYTNAYTGYSCTLDENWEFYTAQELQELPEGVAEALEGSDVGAAMEGVEQVTDMMAENATDLVTINVLYQKNTLEQRLAYAIMSDDAILDQVLTQEDTMIAAYEQTGILVEKLEKRNVTFLGQERVALHTTATIEGVPYYCLQLFDYRNGAYGVTLTLASFGEDNTTSLLDLFTPVA